MAVCVRCLIAGLPKIARRVEKDVTEAGLAGFSPGGGLSVLPLLRLPGGLPKTLFLDEEATVFCSESCSERDHRRMLWVRCMHGYSTC